MNQTTKSGKLIMNQAVNWNRKKGACASCALHDMDNEGFERPTLDLVDERNDEEAKGCGSLLQSDSGLTGSDTHMADFRHFRKSSGSRVEMRTGLIGSGTEKFYEKDFPFDIAKIGRELLQCMSRYAERIEPDMADDLSGILSDFTDMLLSGSEKEYLFGRNSDDMLYRINDPFVPFELLFHEGRFLPEISSAARQPCSRASDHNRISVERVVIVQPKMTNFSVIDDEVGEITEAEMITEIFRKKSKLSEKPLEIIRVKDKDHFHRIIDEWDFDVLHIAAHNVATDVLDDLTPLVFDEAVMSCVKPLSLKMKLCKKFCKDSSLKGPMIFMNCPHSSRHGYGLSGITGWAPLFMKAGAEIFIGHAWTPRDHSAFYFAKKLYESLVLHDQPVGRAMRQARQEIKNRFFHDENDPTWLAYQLFGHPGTGLFFSP